jgi:hypothetical protein
VTAARRPESQEQILRAAAASLTEADIPPEDQDGWLDRDTDPPAELAALPDAELDALLAAAPPRPAPSAWPLSYPSIGPGGERWPAGPGGVRWPAGPGGERWPAGPGGERWPAGPGPRDGADRMAGPASGAGAAGPASGAGAAGPASGAGAGFAEGGPLDVLIAGLPLTGFADDAHARLAALTDDELVGVLRAWRRQTSWAQARELAAVAELARRRPAEGTPPATAPDAFPAKLSEFIAAEVGAALTLTGCAAGAELDLALDLTARPATAAALEAGEIDLPRAKILTSLLGPLSAAHADAVEAQILPRAAGMTTGQLSAALRRAVLSADPQAARRRREGAEREARVEHWAEPEGTASLAGRGLPPAAALTASSRLTQIATAWKKQGARGGMDLLRAHAYLALLNGHSLDLPPASLLPPELVPGPPRPGDGPAADLSGQDGTAGDRDGTAAGRDGTAAPGPGGVPAGSGRSAPGPHGGPADGGPAASRQHVPAGLRGPGPGGPPPAAGLINLTVPLTTLLGLAETPGEAAGHGPLDAAATRQIARALAGHPATRWQITITCPHGRALAHGTARGPIPAGTLLSVGQPERGQPYAGQPGRGWTVAVTAEPITTGRCGHRDAEPGYRPSPALQRLIRARTVTCAGPGCRRPAARCDLDHTIPHDQHGLTCQCNLAPLCRFCHRLKQAHGWTLKQASPGVMTWTTPAGRRYTTLPSKHPT